MSEWKPNGNPMPKTFTGTVTEDIQYLVDYNTAEEHLATEIPEQCHECPWVRANIIPIIASRVIKEEITPEIALAEMRQRTRSCSGPQYDERYADKLPDCPIVEADKRSSRTHCW